MQQSMHSYPTLASLISGWFHQDFDIEGETIEDIINAFNKSSSAEERQLLISDISDFLKISDDEIDKEFDRIFTPDIDPKGFATSTRAFLREILKYIAAEK